jgi:hypothetical protein
VGVEQRQPGDLVDGAVEPRSDQRVVVHEAIMRSERTVTPGAATAW